MSIGDLQTGWHRVHRLTSDAQPQLFFVLGVWPILTLRHPFGARTTLVSLIVTALLFSLLSF